MELRRLVADLLDLGALQSGTYRLHPGPINLSAFIEDCLSGFRQRAETKGLVLEGGVMSGLPAMIHADEDRLRQVLLVLLDNAVKFTKCGRVSVIARRGAGRCEEIPVSRGPVPVGSWVELLVTDTGPGISEEQQRKLVQLFAVLDRPERVRSGLSLAIAARWCAVMGGGLWVSSDGLHGTTFIIRLPLGLPSGSQAMTQESLSPAMPSVGRSKPSM